MVPPCTRDFSRAPAHLGAELTSPHDQPDDTAEALGSRLETNWLKRRAVTDAHNKTLAADAKKKRPSLTGALVASFGAPFGIAAIFKVPAPSFPRTSVC